MKKILLHFLLSFFFGVALLAHAGAQEDEDETKGIKIFGEFQNILLIQSDRDFDDTEPAYQPYGQSVGVMATYVNPKITLTFNQETTIFYEGELGLNIWSRNRDGSRAEESRPFVLHHRQLFGEGKLGPAIQFRTGYQYLEDPTGLFLGHWIGALNATFFTGLLPVSISFGQFPDQTHEGWNVDENNFFSDIFISSLSTDTMIGDRWSVSGGVCYLYDGEEIDRAGWLLTPTVRAAYARASWEVGWDAAFQYGEAQQGTFPNPIERTLAWAAQGYATGEGPPFGWEINLLALSGDDRHDRNGENHAFLYSGKSLSATLMLSEDEYRDWGNNLDELIGEYDSGFFRMRTGLLLIDGKVSLGLSPTTSVSLIAGGAITLEKENSLDHSFLGAEADFELSYTPSPQVRINVINGILIPGQAAAAFVNEIDPGASRPVVRGEVSLNILF